MPKSNLIRLVIVDDHEVVRIGLLRRASRATLPSRGPNAHRGLRAVKSWSDSVDENHSVFPS
jgi:hypothetical protein